MEAAVVQSRRVCPAGILVYDTGFPIPCRGVSREPGFESRRPHFMISWKRKNGGCPKDCFVRVRGLFRSGWRAGDVGPPGPVKNA